MKNEIYLEYRDPLAQKIKQLSGYKGRHISVIIQDYVSFGNTYWDCGSRYSYQVVSLNSNKVLSVPHVPPPPFNKGIDNVNHKTFKIEPNIAVIENYQGRYNHVTLYLHPDNQFDLLPEKTEDLTLNEKIVLYATRSLKSSYAGIKNLRYHESHKETGITLDEYNQAKESLIKKKLLNKAGAITVSGRNAIGNGFSWPKK